MHVFIDTNILLNFFHFSKDELDALNNVFASHEQGAAKVHLTQQVCDEFRRNRENKIKDALKRFKESKFTVQLPSFMKGYEEYDSIRLLIAACKCLRPIAKFPLWLHIRQSYACVLWRQSKKAGFPFPNRPHFSGWPDVH